MVNLALAALGTHLDTSYRREGVTVSRLGTAIRRAAAAAFAGAVILAMFGLIVLAQWQHEKQDAILTASGAAGIAVSPNTRLGVTAQGTGAGGDAGFDLVWRLGAHPKLLAHFTGGAPVAFAPGSQTVLAAALTGVTEWSLADPARPARIATMPGRR